MTLKRRNLIAAAALVPLGARVVSAAPPAEQITPALIDAAKKEGKVTYYTAMDLSVAEPMAKAFEARYPGIKVAVERTGAERLFNRIGQEAGSNIRRCDVVNSSDAAHFIVWKRQDWLAPFVTVDIAETVAPEQRDADGTYTNQRTHLSTMAYNTSLLKPEDAPKGFVDLLDPKYAGKLVKGHPAYSGTIMTATQQVARELGWGYFEKLAKQKVLQVQSATEPPKRIEAGERAIAVDGSERARTADRGHPAGRGHAADLQPDGGLQERAQPQRRAPAGRLDHVGRGPEVHRRPERPVSGQPEGRRQGRPAVAVVDQDAARGSGRGREDGGRDQGQVCQVLQGMSLRWERATPVASSFAGSTKSATAVARSQQRGTCVLS